MPWKIDAAACDAAGRFQQPDDREGGRRFAAARFADQAKRLAFADLERDVVDGDDRPRFEIEDGGEALDDEDGFSGHRLEPRQCPISESRLPSAGCRLP